MGLLLRPLLVSLFFLNSSYPVGWWTAVFGIYLLISAFIKRHTTELVITDKRVISKKGWIVRKSSEIHRSKVEGVEVNQGLIGRIMGYGTVVVRGTGVGLAPMKDIDDPLELRRNLTE